MLSQKLKTKISTLFTFLRQVYTGIDNNIVAELNEDLEKKLLTLADVIPDDWINGFYDSVELTFEIASCIRVGELANVVNKHKRARLWFRVNTYEAFLNNLVIGKYDRDIEKAIVNICVQFKPLFKAVDNLLANPGGILSKIAQMYPNDVTENADIFAGI